MAALMLLDACIRLLPGVMGAASSGVEESFENGLLEYPHYTRPAEWEGRTIPEVLRSGDHAKIAAWRKQRAEDDTRLRRPDLWERHRGARDQTCLWRAARRRRKKVNEPHSTDRSRGNRQGSAAAKTSRISARATRCASA
jgi:tRNA (guanine37-N1)-methyltransferase